MCNTGMCMHESAHLTSIYMDAMCCDHLCFEQALFLHIRDDRDAILSAHVFHFEGGLGKMRMQRHVELFCKFSSSAQYFSRAGVRCMRRHSRDDQGMIFPSLN